MEWYPTPSYLVKRKAILEIVEKLPEKDFLEVGCGAGDLLRVLEQKGYEGLGVDYSPEVVKFARQSLSGRVACEVKNIEAVEGEFSVVIASEVMEHHEDDVGFLKKLADLTKPGGHVIITVPARMSRWGANDDFSGHVRRYERDELGQKFIDSGLEPLFVHSYGVPIYNMMKPIYDRGIKKQIETGEGQEDRTRKSGGMWLFVEMKTLFRLFFNDITMFPFYILQKLFYSTDLGNGYIALGRKAN